MIPIDRGSHTKALASMTAAARREPARGRQIVIFPEGTRRAPGAKPRYLPGVAFLYAELGLPCVPIALNSGLFWPRRSLRRHPGTVLVEVLDPIPPGLEKREFLSACSYRDSNRRRSKRPPGLSRKASAQLTARLLPLEPFGDQMQIGLAIAKRFQRLHRFQHIVAIGTRAAMTLPDVMHALASVSRPAYCTWLRSTMKHSARTCRRASSSSSIRRIVFT